MKKILNFLLLFVISIIFTNTACAENFVIKNYDVQMVVNEKKNFQITETIDVFFTSRSHGIFRTIPTKNEIKRVDGSGYIDLSRITDIHVNEEYTKTYLSNGVLKLKIGNPERTIKGNKKYVIRYNYQMNPDELDNADELYFNIIGTGWNVPIEKVTFKVTMPKPFNTEMIGLSIGKKGQIGFKNGAVFGTDGKIIQGETQRILFPREGITLRITLPENYFEKPLVIDTYVYIIAMIILTIITLILWYVYGRDEKVIPVVNFYPPEKRNSAEVGVEYEGRASTKEIVSLIIYLASKGYIEIEDDGRNFTLYKLKEYDGGNSVEKDMMKALFGVGKEVSKYDLEYSTSFYKDCKDIEKKLNKIRRFIFEPKACSWEKILTILLCIAGIITLYIYKLGNESFYLTLNPDKIIPMIFPVIAILIISGINLKQQPLFIKGFLLIWFIGFAGFPTAALIQSTPEILSNIELSITALICLIISLICLVNMPKRSKNGRLVLGHILGFKKFLEVAEKRRIESLISENPAYCYDIIAFAYVLGVSDEWIKNFEEIILEPPNWYRGSFNRHSFRRFTSSIASTAVPSTANGGISTSSGSSGGGGFSGGGGGGGGGGSW